MIIGDEKALKDLQKARAKLDKSPDFMADISGIETPEIPGLPGLTAVVREHSVRRTQELLAATDYKEFRADKSSLTPEFLAWRESLRDIIRNGGADKMPKGFGGE